MKNRKLTHYTSKKIARAVLKYFHSGVDSRTVDLNSQIDGWLAEIGLGWKLKDGAYIDGVSCQFIGKLADDIRNHAIEK